MEGTLKIPKIKICGITEQREAEFLKEAKADYAGFVFYEKSRRNISPAKAAKIAESLLIEQKKVAVTVSPEIALVTEIEKEGFDILQVHGELSREVRERTVLPIWRAVNIADADNLERLFQEEEKAYITGYVVDGAGYGGGKPFDWEACSRKIQKLTAGKQLILAGGLTSENVKIGISYFKPDIVDVSSGVEENGKKSKFKIETFIRKVREDEQ